MSPSNRDYDLVGVLPSHSQRWVIAMRFAGALVLVAFAAVALSVRPWAAVSEPLVPVQHNEIVEQPPKPVAPAQHNEIVVQPPREKCARTGSNCFDQKCCKTSGYTCYEVHPGYAKCMTQCVTGVDGSCVNHTVTALARKSSISLSSTNLFCFSFYMHDTGSTKTNHELNILRTNLFLRSSIFGCEKYRVYSDTYTWLSPGQVETVVVHDVEKNFHFAKRKKTGTWVNSNMFIAVWKKIREEDLWSSTDWTVKVDVDAVFLPMRLREKLNTVQVTDKGVYLENCKYVNYGFFGNLEVFSHTAVQTYLANLDDCKTSLNYMGKEKCAGYEPWGEDLFAQRCMDLHGVNKVSAWDITVDGLCEAYRPNGQKKNGKWKPDCATTKTATMHPFQKPTDYFQCLKATQR